MKITIDYGQTDGVPGKLANAIHMLVNRRACKYGKSIPAVIRVGSIADIAQDLGLAASSDVHVSIETALRQIVDARIEGKVLMDISHARQIHSVSREALRANKEADIFYQIVFPGEKLPDGAGADAIHVVLG